MHRGKQIAEAPPRHEVSVQEVIELSGGVYLLRTDRPDCEYSPGDCVSIFSCDGLESRPYSLCSDVHASDLLFLFRRFDEGRVSKELAALLPGDRLELSPPFGWFRPAEERFGPKIYCATGTGIAPFLSARLSGAPAPAMLMWGGRDEANLPMPELFPERRIAISPQRVNRFFGEIDIDEQPQVYACGHQSMIETLQQQLIARGLPRENFHSEIFFR